LYYYHLEELCGIISTENISGIINGV